MYELEALKQEKQGVILNDWADLWLRDDKKAGYVGITHNFNHMKWYGSDEKHQMMTDTKGKQDQFITLNAFNKGRRIAPNLKQLRVIGIDLDHYKNDLSILEVEEILFDMVKEDIIPAPNLVITSRGTQLFYDIERGASPKMAWLTSYITEQFIDKLKEVGADSQAKDVSRVMRVPDSVNSRNGATVTPRIWRNTPYTLQELQTYCKPLEKFRNSYKRRFKPITHINKGLNSYYAVSHARLVDFEKLIELRNGEFTHMRNTFLYIYAFHESINHDSLDSTVEKMRGLFSDVFSQSNGQLPEREFERTVKSAYNDAKTFFDYFVANGYKITNKTADGIIKPRKSSNIIDMLEITEAEQKHLRTLITPEVRRERDRQRKTKENRAKGIRPIDEYNKQRADKKRQNVERLAELMAEYPDATQREYADMLGVSVGTVNTLKKIIER